MFNLVIVPNNSGNFGCGHFNTRESAIQAQKNVRERQKLGASQEFVDVVIEDDYGTVISIPAASISYTTIVDVQGKSAASIESKLSEARANLNINQRMATDTELQVLSRFIQSQQPQVVHVGPSESRPSQPN